MNVLILPFNAAKNTNHVYARQFSQYFANVISEFSGYEFGYISYLKPQDENSPIQVQFNPIEELNLKEDIDKLGYEYKADVIIDGLLSEENNENFHFQIRFNRSNGTSDLLEYSATKDTLFTSLIDILKGYCTQLGLGLPDELDNIKNFFNTESAEAFLQFIQGTDGISYLQRSQGNVDESFKIEDSFNHLAEACTLDNEFDVAYRAALKLVQDGIGFNVADPTVAENLCKKLVELRPNNAEGNIMLGRFYYLTGNPDKCLSAFEAAVECDKDNPEVYIRLGEAQAFTGMINNAEKNFEKAFELEDNDKPSADYLAELYNASGRNHEVPGLWKKLVDLDNNNVRAHIKYGVALYRNDKKEDAVKVFENVIQNVENSNAAKKIYAKLLMEEKNFDKAMDLFEDYIDNEPTDADALISYAFTLQNAGREFEVPPVLQNILKLDIDADTRAHINAWNIEMLQPKRLESYTEALAKMESGNMEAALQLLRPLKNWLPDYWKVWALLTNCLISSKNFDEAEQTVYKLLEMYPGYVEGYANLTDIYIAKNKADEAFKILISQSSKFQDSIPFAITTVKAANASGRKDVAENLSKSLLEATNNNENIKKALDEVMSPLIIL